MTKSVTVVHSTDPTIKDNDETFQPTPSTSSDKARKTSLVKNKIKLAKHKARLTLEDLYKNRKKESASVANKDNVRKKKRVITKIVRRPLRRFHPKVEEAILGPEDNTLDPTTTTKKPGKFSAFTERPEEEESSTTTFPTTTTEIPTTSRHEPVTPVVVSVEEVPAEFLPVGATTTLPPLTPTEIVEEDVTTQDEYQTDPPLPTVVNYQPDEEEVDETTIPTLYVPSTIIEDNDKDLVVQETTAEHFQPTTFPVVVELNEDKTKKIPDFLPPTPIVTTQVEYQEATTFRRPPVPTVVSTPEEVSVQSSTVAAYEPTPFKIRPNRFRNIWAPKTSETTVSTPVFSSSTTTAAPKTNSLGPRYRQKIRYGSSADRLYGSRIKSRKRPTFWINGYETTEKATEEPVEVQEEQEEEVPSKTDEYKRKFRPFFDKLYDKLTKKTPRRDPLTRYYTRRRSTTPAPTADPHPFTLNAEIYEVNPEGKRITATSPDTPR